MSGEDASSESQSPDDVHVGSPSTDPSTDVSGSMSDAPSIGEVADPADLTASDEIPVDGLPVDEAEGSGDPVLELMAVLEAERDGYLLDLQRVTAEFANYRKQADRRTTEVGGRARGGLVEKLLVVFDACDLALEHGADDVAPIRASLVQVLEPVGLEVLDPVDELFDPNRHDAVLHEPAADGDDAGQVVVEVLRRGYAWEGRVLRPAMVRVRG